MLHVILRYTAICWLPEALGLHGRDVHGRNLAMPDPKMPKELTRLHGLENVHMLFPDPKKKKAPVKSPSLGWPWCPMAEHGKIGCRQGCGWHVVKRVGMVSKIWFTIGGKASLGVSLSHVKIQNGCANKSEPIAIWLFSSSGIRPRGHCKSMSSLLYQVE